MIEFSKADLVEISEVITRSIDKLIAAGDQDQRKKQYGTLMLLHEHASRASFPNY